MSEAFETETRSLGDAPGAVDPADGSFPIVAREHYAIVGEIARGGGGRLLRARDRRLDRDVAIKEPLVRSSYIERRFFHEAQLTARLQHPSIVPVHEIGRWPTGEPFYAMKLVLGRSLADVIDDARSLADRLALLPVLIAIADALAYAHGQGIVHRDLKPGNVMVGAFGETQVIDWGLAVDLRGGDRDVEAGAIRGTPSTMAPEQARGEPVDERTDVYALGALLYHVLAGEPPYRGGDVLARVLAGPPPALAARVPAAPIELVAIAERAMARAPAARFASAVEVAAELRRFQTGQLVASHRYTARQLLGRWLRRRRVPVAIAAAALVALVVVGGASLREVLAARARADARADDVVVDEARLTLEHDPGAAVALLASLPTARLDAETRTIAAEAALRGLPHVLPGNGRAHGLHFAPGASGNAGHVIVASDDGRVHVWDLATWTDHPVAASAHPILDAAMRPDGTLVSVDTTGAIAGAPAMGAPPLGALTSAALSRDAHWIAAFRADGTTEIRDLATGSRHVFHKPFVSGSWSDDDASLALVEGGPDHQLGVLSTATGHVTAISGSNGAAAVTGSLDTGGRVAWVEHDVLFERIEHIPSSHPIDEEPVAALAYMPGNALVASAGDAEASAGRPRVRIADTTVRVYGEGRVIAELVGARTDVERIAAAPDGHAIAAIGRDGRLVVWTLPDLHRAPGEHGLAASVAAAGERGEGFFGSAGPAFARVDVATGAITPLACCDDAPPRPAAPARVATDAAWPVAYDTTSETPTTMLVSRDGARAVALDSGGRVWALDADRARFVADGIAEIALSDDGATLATRGADGLARRWTFARVADPAGAADPATIAGTTAIALSADGSTLVAACADGVRTATSATTADAARSATGAGNTPSATASLAGAAPGARAVAISADGRTIAAANERGAIDLWAGGAHRQLHADDGAILLLAFAPAGDALVSLGDDQTLRSWDLRTDRATVFTDRTGGITALRFRADGSGFVTTGADHYVRLWDLAARRSRVLRDGDSSLPDLFGTYRDADRRVLVLTSVGGAFDLADDLPRTPEALHAWLVRATAP